MRNARHFVTRKLTSLLTARLAAVRMSEGFVLHLAGKLPRWKSETLFNESPTDALDHSHLHRGPDVI